jgi:hypothetical protein
VRVSARDFADERLLDVLGAGMRARHRSDLAGVERFALFVGYPGAGTASSGRC